MSPAPPARTPEQRQAGLQAARDARAQRAQVRDKIAKGLLTVQTVLFRGEYGQTDELGDHARVVGRMRVKSVLTALNGIGSKRADSLLVKVGVENKRVDQLSRDAVLSVLQELYDRGYR